MVRTHADIDVAEMHFDADASTGRTGNKYVRVSLEGRQVEFQLGVSPREALRSPFGIGPASKEQDESKLQIKVEMDG